MATISASTGPLVLTIEDDPTVRQFLNATLTEQGYRVLEALTGQVGLLKAAAHHPGLVLLDLGLPDFNGLEITRRLREWTMVPIVVLSGRKDEASKVAALDAGADDYITKPFGVEELLARVRVAFRHAERNALTAEEPLFSSGELRVDFVHRLVTVGDKAVHLTPTEYRLLAALARNAGKVVRHRDLLKEVWGPEYARESNYLRVYLKHLRTKLEPNPAQPRFLLSEPGVGYRLAVTSAGND